jgi:hypothetical protein
MCKLKMRADEVFCVVQYLVLDYEDVNGDVVFR